MEGYIEVKTEGRRQLVRIDEVLRLEETIQGTVLIHIDSWDREPIRCEDGYEAVRTALLTGGLGKPALPTT